ncbi:MAG: hypothetical protein B6229_03985 [Spirochaetaceae bacterium 4572_7]|nr:MAG: hypothetical protein B6229_03985 [Spirochaetaceae bacterium 4572_7]
MGYLITIVSTLIVIFLVYRFWIRFKEKQINITAYNEKISRNSFIASDLISISKITENNSQYKILVVEDDPVNRKILTAQLSSAHYNIVAVETGTEAIKVITQDIDIDLVLLDIMLPDLSGFTVCRSIRERFNMFEKPIIMVTAKNYIKDLVDGFEAGANDFITKPYNIYELIARINSSISLKRVVEYNSSLEKNNKLKSDIMDMAAHDLRSPLTIISGYANRLLKRFDPKGIDYENISKILRSSNKMLSIICKLLKDSKYENLPIDIEPVDISNLIKKSIEFYSDSAESKYQNIICTYPDQAAILNIDSDSFSTIIDNLLSNAIKYSPLHSQINIDIKINKNNILISIKDQGDGFTKDEIENLFVKYFPFSSSATQGESSVGLGLSIVKSMVSRYLGTITVESQKGEGSNFILTFPRE